MIDRQQKKTPFKIVVENFSMLWDELEILRSPTTKLKEMMESGEHDQVFGLHLGSQSR